VRDYKCTISAAQNIWFFQADSHRQRYTQSYLVPSLWLVMMRTYKCATQQAMPWNTLAG